MKEKEEGAANCFRGSNQIMHLKCFCSIALATSFTAREIVCACFITSRRDDGLVDLSSEVLKRVAPSRHECHD